MLATKLPNPVYCVHSRRLARPGEVSQTPSHPQSHSGKATFSENRFEFVSLRGFPVKAASSPCQPGVKPRNNASQTWSGLVKLKTFSEKQHATRSSRVGEAFAPLCAILHHSHHGQRSRPVVPSRSIRLFSVSRVLLFNPGRQPTPSCWFSVVLCLLFKFRNHFCTTGIKISSNHPACTFRAFELHCLG